MRQKRVALLLGSSLLLSSCFWDSHPQSAGSVNAAAENPKIAGFVSLHDLLDRVSCDLLQVKQDAHASGVDFPSITGSIYITVAKQNEYAPSVGLTIPILSGVTFGPKAKLDISHGDTRTLTLQFAVKDPAGPPPARCADRSIPVRSRSNGAGSPVRIQPLFKYENMQHVFDPRGPVKFTEEDFKGAFELKRTVSTNGEIDFLIVKLDPLAAGFTSDYVQGFEVKFSTKKPSALALNLMDFVPSPDIALVSDSVVFRQVSR